MIDDDRKHIRVIDHAFVDVLPVGAAIGRLPGQVPGSGINHVGIFGINSNRFDVLDVDMIRW